MELEFHQLDRRYETLRRRSPDRERRLLASLAEHGQQAPIIVVVDEGGHQVLVDGYKRVRALESLRRDTVVATKWDLAEEQALVLARLMRAGDGDDAMEQAWLLRELRARFDLSEDELATRFDKSKSWVSRRLALVERLPEWIQEQVRAGWLGAHAAAKYLAPLARANDAQCVALVKALAPKRATSRERSARCTRRSSRVATRRGRLCCVTRGCFCVHAPRRNGRRQTSAHLRRCCSGRSDQSAALPAKRVGGWARSPGT